MTLAVLRRGLIAVVPEVQFPVTLPIAGATASLLQPGCWHPESDGPALHGSWPLLLQELGLQGKPVYGIGISSGGVMLAALASGFHWAFAGLHFQVSTGGALDTDPYLFKFGRWPRASFVYMTHDVL